MHTPGPWKADGLRVWAYDEGEPVYIASLKFADDNSLSEEELEDNTKLIAAAPDLLAALQDLLDMDADDEPHVKATQYEKGRAAITKATA